MLTSRITRDNVPIPHEPGEWMSFRKLSWRKLEEAGNAVSDDAIAKIKVMGGEAFKAIQDLVDARERKDKTAEAAAEKEIGESLDEAEQKVKDPLNKYDRGVLLRKGIIDWSYEGDKPTVENTDDLDEETAVWAARQILDLAMKGKTDEEKNAPTLQSTVA